MRKLNQSGSLPIPLILISVLLFGSLAFAGWALMGRQDYKNNSDKKSAVAVAAAVKVEGVKKDAEFAEAEKSPLKTYTGPSTYGSLSIMYPKTWDAYITDSSNKLTDGYFSPNYVPDVKSDTAFALRVQISSTAYASVLKSFDSSITTGKVNAVAYKSPKVPDVLGTQLTGEIAGKKQGIMVVLPLRDKTIQIWTEGDEFRNDFTDTVLPNISFIP